MKSLTELLWFNVPARRGFVNITGTIEELVRKSGVKEGLCLVNAGVARTERSIVNWCQANSAGIARLDAYLDPNEGKYFITPQSAEAAIKEEQAKYTKAPTPAEPFRNEAPVSDPPRKPHASYSEESHEDVSELQKELMDLKIANRGKDYFIEQFQRERESFATERKEYVEKLMTFNRKVGELETRLLPLEAPKDEDQTRRLRVISNDEPSA